MLESTVNLVTAEITIDRTTPSKADIIIVIKIKSQRYLGECLNKYLISNLAPSFLKIIILNI